MGKHGGLGRRLASRLGGAFVVGGPVVFVLNVIQLLTELYGSQPNAEIPQTVAIVVVAGVLIPVGAWLLSWAAGPLVDEADVLRGEILDERGTVVYDDVAHFEREARAVLAPNRDVALARRLVARFSPQRRDLSS